jgi:hypothetical protein
MTPLVIREQSHMPESTTLRQIVTPSPMPGRVPSLIVTSTAGFLTTGAGLGTLSFLIGGYGLVMAVSTLGLFAQADVFLRSLAARTETISSATTPSLAAN